MAKKKTPAFLVELISRHMDAVYHLDELLRVKRTVRPENQGAHIREKTEAELIAHLQGKTAMLEDALFCYGCYGGFCYRGPKKMVRLPNCDTFIMSDVIDPKHPDFQEWRRDYFTR